MPHSTLESPLSISQAKALIESLMLHQDAEKMDFRNSYVLNFLQGLLLKMWREVTPRYH